MSAQSDVKAVTLTSTNTAVDRRSRVRGVFILCGGTAGSVVLKDGGSGGGTELDIATPASATTPINVDIPDNGILFETDVHVTITNAASVIVFYE